MSKTSASAPPLFRVHRETNADRLAGLSAGVSFRNTGVQELWVQKENGRDLDRARGAGASVGTDD